MAKSKNRPKIHASVRLGGAVYMADNDDHAEMLAETLDGRACRRLLDNGAISGDAFEKTAAAWEKENKEAAEAAQALEEQKRARRQAQRPWAHPPGSGNDATNEAPAAAEGDDGDKGDGDGKDDKK